MCMSMQTHTHAHTHTHKHTQGSRNWSGQSGHSLTSFGSSIFKKIATKSLKSAISLSQFSFLQQPFLSMYLTTVHNMELAKV